MNQVHVIRHQVLVEGRSQRSVSREHGVSRNMVRKYVEVSEPVFARPAGRRPVTETIRPRFEELVEDWSNRQTKKTADSCGPQDRDCRATAGRGDQSPQGGV